MTFIDLFSGVGGFRRGFELAGHTCVGHCEIDMAADRAYRAIHEPSEEEWFEKDITQVRPENVPTCDGWSFGFPCQDASQANSTRRGLDGGRSGLFYEVVRLLAGRDRSDRPQWLIAENVVGLLSVAQGVHFDIILSELAALGYDCEWEVVNSKDHNVPQSRERVYIIGHLGGFGAGKIFPLGGANPAHLREIVSGHQGDRVYDANGLAVTLTSGSGGMGGKTGLYAVGFNRLDGITKEIDTAYTLLASDAKGLQTNQTQTAVFHPRAVNSVHKEEVRQNGRRIKEPEEPMFCLVTVGHHGIELSGRIRRLTPRECFRLQGWDDASFEKAQAVSSDSALYRMAGNGVTVTVTYAIGKKLKELENAHA